MRERERERRERVRERGESKREGEIPYVMIVLSPRFCSFLRDFFLTFLKINAVLVC